MNDPNGMVYYDGEYHLFYQHNPFGEKWGHMRGGAARLVSLEAWPLRSIWRTAAARVPSR